MAHTEDPLSWLRLTGVARLWDYGHFLRFTRVYQRARRWQQLEARSVLPNLDAETRVVGALRSPDRVN
jgi:hypothetical protein